MVKALAAQESWTEEHCTQVVKGALLTLVNVPRQSSRQH
ncbi:hypothetical protein HaLaN_01167, partial [Haematococcus lacustris]